MTGPDGNLWFMNQAPPNFAIGRVSPTGEIKEFAITGTVAQAQRGSPPARATNLYFGAAGENARRRKSVIGELTQRRPDDQIAKRMDIPEPPQYLAAGPEGSLWFTALPTEPDKSPMSSPN